MSDSAVKSVAERLLELERRVAALEAELHQSAADAPVDDGSARRTGKKKRTDGAVEEAPE